MTDTKDELIAVPLLDCPFCGSSGKVIASTDDRSFSAGCAGDHGVLMRGFKTEDVAIAAWNRRAAPSVLVEQDKGSFRADALHTQPGAEGAVVDTLLLDDHVDRGGRWFSLSDWQAVHVRTVDEDALKLGEGWVLGHADAILALPSPPDQKKG